MDAATLASFLAVCTQSSAALIGLLFVSVSRAPADVFGPKASADRQTAAQSAFTALADAFLLSFVGLLPDRPLGPFAIVLGALALGQLLTLLRLWPRWRSERRLVRGLGVFLVSVGVFGDQILTGIRLSSNPNDPQALTTLLGLLVGMVALSLARAWELLGASRDGGLMATLASFRSRPSRADEPPPAARRRSGRRRARRRA